MKKVISLLLAALSLGIALPSCSAEDDFLTHKYNYDLSEYIELGNYKGLPAQGYHYSVTDEQIDQQILASRAYYARTNTVTDRGANWGDIVIIDYVTTDAEGNEIESYSASDYELHLGFETFIDEFESACIGAYAGDHISADGTFPESYPDYPELAGMDVHFEIDVTEVSEQELPEYNEDFVRAYLGYDSIEDYESSIRETLEERYKSVYYEYVVGQTWDTVVQSTVVKKYPEAEVKEMYDDMVSSSQAYAKAKGINFADYVKLVYDMSEDEFYEFAQSEAEARVKQEMICYAIARAENLSLTEEEYVERATEYATEYYELDSLEAFEKLYDKGTIRQTLLMDKAKEAIVDLADVTYVE